MKKAAACDSSGAVLRELDVLHDDVLVFDADSSAAQTMSAFKKAFPDQYFNCGVTGENVISTAVGSAAMGLTPFVCMFALGTFEQIRNFAPCSKLKIADVHDSVCKDCTALLCDFSFMRSVPGVAVLCPADGVETRAAVRAAYEYQGPIYLRLSKLAVPVFREKGIPFQDW